MSLNLGEGIGATKEGGLPKENPDAVAAAFAAAGAVAGAVVGAAVGAGAVWVAPNENPGRLDAPAKITIWYGISF